MAARLCSNNKITTSPPRETSLAIMVHFTFHLSTNTPASGLMNAMGVRNTTQTMLTSNAFPWSWNVTMLNTANSAT